MGGSFIMWFFVFIAIVSTSKASVTGRSRAATEQEGRALCPAAYARQTQLDFPLLFGGVLDGCNKGCQPRDGSAWSRACRRDPANPVWGLCEPAQRTQLLAYMQQKVEEGSVDESLLGLNPCELHSLLASEGRTLWLIGDSHIKQIYGAMRCFMTDMWQHEEGECAASSDKALQDLLDDVSATGHPYRTPPRCLHLINGNGARICLVHSPKGDMFFSKDPTTLGTLQLLQRSFVAPQDIMYISVGRWHANNCEGVGRNWTSILTSIGQFAAAAAAPTDNIYFSPSPHDHVACLPNRNLDLPSKGVCVPASQGGYNLATWQQVVHLTEQILGSTYKLPIINTYKWAVPMFWAHIHLPNGNWDCLHYCRPGFPELEIWHMVQAIKKRGLSGRMVPGSQAAGRICRPVAFQFQENFDDMVPLDRDDFGYLLPATPPI